MALKDRSSFGGGRVAAPNLGSSVRAFSQVGQLAASEQDRILKEQMLADKQEQIAIENQRADEALQLDALRREQDMQMEAAKVGLTSDYRQAQLAQEDRAFGARRGDVAYERGVGEGEILGARLPTTEFEETDVTTETLDRDILAQEYKKLAPTVGMEDKERQQAWIDYQKQNVPGYSDAVPLYEQAADVAKTNLMRGPQLALEGTSYVMDALTTKSQEQKDAEALGKKFAPKEVKPLTRSEFMSGLTQDDKDAKEAVKAFLKEDKGYQKEIGALKEATGKGMTRVDKDKLFAEIDTGAAQYAADYKARTGKNLPKSQMMGMLKSGYANVAKIVDVRAASDAEQIKVFNKQADTQLKQQFKRELVVLKDKLGKIPTAEDKAKLAKTLLETKLLQQEYKDAQGFFD